MVDLSIVTSVPSDTSAAAAPMGGGALLQLLRRDGPHTRAELATRTGLARSTVALRIEALLSAGLLTGAGEASSTGGRPPVRFMLNPAARAVIGVDLGASHVTVAATDLRGQVRSSVSQALDIALGPTTVLDRVIELVARARTDADLNDVALAGIGIGLPGPVEHATGRPTSPPIMPGWDGYDVPGHLRRILDGPVLVDNDVNVMAIGEHAAAWSSEKHLLFVKVATGIGAGIIADGRINRGSQGSAGDLGHVQVPDGEPRRCRCGNTGCLEALAAGPALAERLRERGVDVRDASDVVDRVKNGDAAAIDVLRQGGREIGSVLATCVSLLNPSVIVIGGRMAAVGEHLLAGIREVAYRRTAPLAAQDLQIVASTTKERAGVLGAATMVIDSVLSADSVDRELAAFG